MIIGYLGKNPLNPPISIRTFIRRFETNSKPVLVECMDGSIWVVKGRQRGRENDKIIYNDRVIASIGHLLKAPIPEITLVQIDEEFVSNCPPMRHMLPGIGHGSLYMKDCTDRLGIQQHYLNEENMARFASLHVLFSWMHPNDQQWIYRKQPPNEAYSVDHGHFFPGGPNWTIESLRGTPPPRHVTELQGCGLSQKHYEEPLNCLKKITYEHLVEVTVHVSPSEWPPFNADERRALTDFLFKRKPSLLDLFGERS